MFELMIDTTEFWNKALGALISFICFPAVSFLLLWLLVRLRIGIEDAIYKSQVKRDREKLEREAYQAEQDYIVRYGRE